MVNYIDCNQFLEVSFVSVIWSIISYVSYQVSCIYIIIKLKKILSGENIAQIMFFNILILLKTISIILFYAKSDEHIKDITQAQKDQHIVKFTYGILLDRFVTTIMEFLSLYVFYWFIIKMFLFWDLIYHSQIEKIYENIDQFQGEERDEIEYEYFKSVGRITFSQKFYKLVMAVLIVVNTIYYGILIAFTGQNQDYSTQVTIVVILTISGLFVFIFDVLMIFLFRICLLQFNQVIKTSRKVVAKSVIVSMTVIVLIKSVNFNILIPILEWIRLIKNSEYLIYNVYNWNVFITLFYIQEVISNVIPIYLGFLLLYILYKFGTFEQDLDESDMEELEYEESDSECGESCSSDDEQHQNRLGSKNYKTTSASQELPFNSSLLQLKQQKRRATAAQNKLKVPRITVSSSISFIRDSPAFSLASLGRKESTRSQLKSVKTLDDQEMISQLQIQNIIRKNKRLTQKTTDMFLNQKNNGFPNLLDSTINQEEPSSYEDIKLKKKSMFIDQKLNEDAEFLQIMKKSSRESRYNCLLENKNLSYDLIRESMRKSVFGVQHLQMKKIKSSKTTTEQK